MIININLGGEKMNKKKLFTILFISVAVLGLTMSAVCAQSTNVKFKDGKFFHKKIGHGDTLSSGYISKYSPESKKKNFIHIAIDGKDGEGDGYFKISKAKVFYKQKGKVKTKVFKSGKGGDAIIKSFSKGQKPYKATVWYKKR